MRISVVTVCRNAADTLGDALASVRAQKLPAGVELEHIVIDGASTDSSPALLARIAAEPLPPGQTFTFVSEPDRGLYDAINKGIARATGDVVGILNADDFFDGTDIVARIAAAFTDDLDAVYGTVRFVRAPGGPTVRRCFARLWRPWMLQWGYLAPHPALFIRRARFAEWGAYDADPAHYRISADTELLIRFFRVHAMRAKFFPCCTTVMRLGGVSTRDFRARLRLNAEDIRANRANGYFCCWPMMLPKYFVKVWEVLLPRAESPYPFFKRLFDVVLSAAALLVLSPILLLIAVAVFLTGGRHVFYGQRRIGRGATHFRMWKFETMREAPPGTPDGAYTPLDDPRLLPLGAFLRGTKLNELPQLFNVLVGDMSLVGPRPLMDTPREPYSPELKRRIYSLRPGLTGIGSVVFRDEERIVRSSSLSPDECYATVITPYKGALETWYLAHVGFLTDLKLVFLTVWSVIAPKSDLVFSVFRDLPPKPAAMKSLGRR